ncbi:MAG TPA: hypothetical protein VHU23_16470 [Rhizomicrobium sp.]|nr:hypothetical protein [Rhizomicrobium sp.]
MLAGFVDYLCHRATHVETASGARETLLHWLMLTEAALPIIAALFFKINALLIAFMAVCLLAHELTGYADLELAMRTRNVTPFEHQVHSLLEVLPFMALILLCVLHWPQTEALFGFGLENADFSLGLKQPPGWDELILPFVAFVLLAVIPYSEELLRGWRAGPPSEQ